MAVKTQNPLAALDSKRLRTMVKGLVISLGYLQHWLEKGGDNSFIHVAATSLDTAIDALNSYLDQQ